VKDIMSQLINLARKNCAYAVGMAHALEWLTTKLSDGLGGGEGAHGALTISRDARTDSGEAVRCSALVRCQS